MSMGALGGASFTVRADTASFSAGMKHAKEEAVRSSQQIGAAVQTIDDKTFTGLANVGRSTERVTKSFQTLGSTVGGSKGGHLGLGLLAVGQAVDDLQYGFRSIVNNIPQVAYMMGGSAGLAGGVAVAAVAINQLINHWDGMVDAMKGQWLNVATNDLEKLRIATEKAGEAFDALIKTPSALGAKEISKMKEAVTDLQKGGAAGLFKGIADAVPLEPGMRAEEGPGELHRRRILEGTIKRMEAPGFRNQMGQIPVTDLKKELHAMNDKLLTLNNTVAKNLIGKALQAGEEGDGARTQLRRLVEKYSGSFSPAFRAAMQRNTPDMLQGEIDLDNAKKAREKARGVAGQMLGSPLGTRVMLGGADSGPATAAELAKITGGAAGRRFAKAGFGDVADQMAKAGLTADQARGVMGNMTIQKTNERIKKEVEAQGNKFNPIQIPMGILNGVYKEMLNEQIGGVKGKPGGMEAAVGKALKAAGVVGQDPKDVLDEMKNQLADRKKDLMVGGMSAKQAEMQMLKEQQQRAFPTSNLPSMFVGITQMSKMIQTGALNGAADIAKRSLDELIAIRTALANRQRQAAAPAVAAGPN